jgi:hypothetical protein
MTLAVKVAGSASFTGFAVACYWAAKQGVAKEFKRGLTEAGDLIAETVQASTDTYMPKGYEKTFKTRLRTKVRVRTTTNMGVTVVAYGLGRHGRRDVERLEQGLLRHPVFGRWRDRRGRFRNRHKIRNPWVVQHIRKGWFSEPADEASNKAFEKLDQAVGRVLDGISKMG